MNKLTPYRTNADIELVAKPKPRWRIIEKPNTYSKSKTEYLYALCRRYWIFWIEICLFDNLTECKEELNDRLRVEKSKKVLSRIIWEE